MDKRMTIEEINDTFNSEWVLLEDPITTDMQEVKSGKLLWHSKNREDVYRKAKEFNPKHTAILYTGKLSDDQYFVI